MKFTFYPKLLILCFFIGLSQYSFATILSGIVKDSEGSPLSFANVYLKGSSVGTTANSDGFYSLNLQPGDYEIAFRYIGYQLKIVKVTIGVQNQSLNVSLESEKVELKEVSINADAEDPAYAVIRKAISKRKHYLNEVKSYSCDSYTKMVQRIKKFPDKIFGIKLTRENMGILDSSTGIIYLSEAVSKFHLSGSDSREEMVSSRVSGSNKSYSFNRAFDQMFNFYEATIEMGGLSTRSFVSPIAPTALAYYKYHLVGIFREGDNVINKIQVIPISRSGPVFAGNIYIVEGTWRIHSTELYITKDNGLQFIDTLKVKQVYAPVKNDQWMRLSGRFDFDFKFMGINGNGDFISVYSNYEIGKTFPKNFFNGEVMKVNESANKRDSAYWNNNRPVPLTADESKDYKKRDSIQVIHESKPYMDSTDRVNNKVKPINLVFGYTYNRSYAGKSFTFRSPLSSIQFNTVEGWVANLGLTFTKQKDDRRLYSINSQLRYGFSLQRFYAAIDGNYLLGKKRLTTISGGLGSMAVQFNQAAPISPLVNTFYSLLLKENYLKIYQKDFVKVGFNCEAINGLRLNAELEYQQRKQLYNTTKQAWTKDSKEYLPNNPVYSLADEELFPNHSAFISTLHLRYVIGQRYITYPDRKVRLGSEYPKLNLRYTKAYGISNNAPVYDKLQFNVNDDMKLGVFGSMTYDFGIGGFINSKRIYFPDYQHFLGNRTIISDFRLNHFYGLSYYNYSTASNYFEGHILQNFGGYFTSKVPLLKKLRLRELAAFNMLAIDKARPYTEFAIGLERGVVPIRLLVYRSFIAEKTVENGIRIALSF